MFFSLGLYPLINKPSRITEYSATLIDNILTNDICTVHNSVLLINDISDHLPVYTINKTYKFLKNQKSKPRFKFIRKTNEESMLTFQQALNRQNWEDLYCMDDVNDAFNYFIDKYIKLYNEHCPLVKVKIRDNNNDKPWNSQEYM